MKYQPKTVDNSGFWITRADTIYEEVIPLLVDVVKGQQQQIDSLINALNNPFLPKNSNGNTPQKTGTIEVELGNRNKIILNQNSPNPFKEQTVITYTIPEGSKNVKILFTDSRSNVLKEVEITQTGNGQLNVYAQDLSSGIYTYTLVVEGVTIDSKKMICSK